MQEVSVIIPNYNGMAYLEGVLSSLEQQEFQNFETILVDNGSSDGSVAFVMGNFPWVHIVELPDNFGFSTDDLRRRCESGTGHNGPCQR